jgi:hypothetical protein
MYGRVRFEISYERNNPIFAFVLLDKTNLYRDDFLRISIFKLEFLIYLDK